MIIRLKIFLFSILSLVFYILFVLLLGLVPFDIKKLGFVAEIIFLPIFYSYFLAPIVLIVSVFNRKYYLELRVIPNIMIHFLVLMVTLFCYPYVFGNDYDFSSPGLFRDLAYACISFFIFSIYHVSIITKLVSKFIN